MNFFAPDILPLSGILILLLLVFGSSGGLMLRFLNLPFRTEGSFASISLSVFLGMVFIIPLFALIWTGCNSIMLLCLPLWAALFFLRGKDSIKPKFHRIRFSRAIIALAVALAVQGLFYYLFFVLSQGNLNGDLQYYANVSANLADSHIETTRVYPESATARMYHYGSAWLTAMVSVIFGANPVYAFCLVSIPILVTVVLYTLIALFDSPLAAVICIIFVPLVVLLLPWMRPAVTNPKLFEILLFTAVFAMLLDSGHRQSALCCLLFCVPFYSSVAPGILTFAFIFGWVERRKILNPASILSAALALLYFVFYALQPSDGLVIKPSPVDWGDVAGSTLQLSAKWTARLVLTLIPTGLILFIRKRNKLDDSTLYKLIYSLGAACIVSALIGSAAKSFIRDGGQIFTNFAEASLPLLVFYILYVSLFEFISSKSARILSMLSMLAFYGACFYFFGSKAFYFPETAHKNDAASYEALLDKINPDEAVFGYYRDYANLGEAYHFFCCTQLYYPLPKLAYFTNKPYSPYCLSVYELPDNLEKIFDDRQHSYLYQFVESGKGDVYDFIKDKKITHIILDSYLPLPSYLEGKVSRIAEIDGNIILKLL